MRLGELVVDVTPLREDPAYRLVFAAQTVTVLTTALTNVAINVHVYQITGSSVQVGLVGLVFGAALLIGLLTGGVLADRGERRRLIIGSRVIVGISLFALAVNASIPSPMLWFVYLAAVVIGLVAGVGGSALMAAIPATVKPQHLAAAGALLTLASQFGAMLGPSVAGLIASGPGVAVCFAIDAVGYFIGIALFWKLPDLRPEGVDEEKEHPLRSIAEGWKFVRSNEIVRGLLIIDLWAMVFAMPYALFPQMAAEVFGGGPEAVGLLHTAPAVGAFIGGLFSGWVNTFRHSGRALIVAVLLWGLAITSFGLSGHLWLGLAFLVVAGAADTTSEILRRALLQHHTPDRLQGRVSSLWLAQATSGPAVGGTAAGLGARMLGPAMGIVAGGVICVAGVVLTALTMPGLRRANLRGEPCSQTSPA